ncbi:DUF4817 domain-containing protein [Trichonephila clavipes]|nr:DUF4817 domain-containing protein [Trichonephila clavipes]
MVLCGIRIAHYVHCDEVHFWLNGYVNKQNCRIWSEANPQVYVETPLHPEKLTVWCALWAGGIIGPYFKNDEGHNVTVNGDRYRAMITNFFIPELNNHDVQKLWFQQDGATCHTARATIDLLKDTFGDRLISRFGPVNWLPRSCDLTLLDYFLWGYVKSLVYADKPQRLDHLEDNIRRVIADIRPHMLEKFIENWTSRLDYIRASHGSHMPEIIFKMFTKLALNSNNTSASEAKLSTFDSFDAPEPEFHDSTGNRIINFQALMGIISILCYPECYATGLKLAEDSKEGLCSNVCAACSCGFMTGFTSTLKENKKFSLKTLLVFGLRLIGRGFTAGKKLLCTLNLPCISKNTFRAHELKLLEAVQLCSEENMKAASKKCKI